VETLNVSTIKPLAWFEIMEQYETHKTAKLKKEVEGLKVEKNIITAKLIDLQPPGGKGLQIGSAFNAGGRV